MIVLGVDAGITTGLAICSGDDHRVLFTAAVAPEVLSRHLDQVVPAVDEVVVEMALIHKRSVLGKDLERVHQIIREHTPEDTTWCDASQWKNTIWGRYKCPRGLTPHERDAIRIACWHSSLPSVVAG
jgi:hypothetical protein